jgi:hypothetical protein
MRAKRGIDVPTPPQRAEGKEPCKPAVRAVGWGATRKLVIDEPAFLGREECARCG